jgi:hypothetical protein
MDLPYASIWLVQATVRVRFKRDQGLVGRGVFFYAHRFTADSAD